MSTTDETWVPLSRGLGKHIPDMNAQACRVYLYLLIYSKATGEDKGKLNISIGQLASDLKMHRVTLQKIITEHLKDKYIKIKGAMNQHDQTEITILKYKTVSNFACSNNTTTKATSKEQPRLQAGSKQVTSTVENESDNTGLQPPKKLRSKEGKKLKKKTKDIVLPDFIDPETWQAYLDMRKKKPATLKAQELIIKKLTNWHNQGQDANDILEQSIISSWMGVFPLNNKSNLSKDEQKTQDILRSQKEFLHGQQ